MWLTNFMRQVARQAVVASALAALVLVAAALLPVWAALQDGEASAAAPAWHSSAGETSTSAMRVENLSAATALGNLPLVLVAQYYNTHTGAVPKADRFVAGAREASLAAYMQDLTWQVSEGYLGHGMSSVQSLNAWKGAVAEEMKREAERKKAAAAAVAGAQYQAPAVASSAPAYIPSYSGGIGPGTHFPGTRITFYACIGNGFCGNMANGQQVFAGAAACSTNLPFGTKFIIEGDPSGRTFICLDRGALSATWVDIWFYDVAEGYAWQSMVGTVGDIIIVE